MDGPRESHTKWNKSEREWEISHDITYIWNLKIGYKWQDRNRITEVENELMVTREQRVNLRDWVDIYTVLYIKLIANKDLLYSTGKSVMAYMGK